MNDTSAHFRMRDWKYVPKRQRRACVTLIVCILFFLASASATVLLLILDARSANPVLPQRMLRRMFPVLRRPPKTMWSRRTPQGPAPPQRQGKVQITFSFLSLHKHRKIRCVPYFSLMLYCAKVYHKKRRENNSRMLLNSRLNIVYFCISIQQSGRNSLQCQPRRAYSGSSARYSPILSSPAAITSGVLA